MFQLYKENQKKFYETIIHSVLENGKISHAYLIETNNFPDSLNLAISFAKFLMCTSHKVDNVNCNDCNICNLIDSNNCPDFRVIEPEGLWIKKEQLLSLKSAFKTKTLENQYRIYIINGAERLNKSAANSILKFLEEPEEKIIAILLTPNRYQVLNTIVSRCQLCRLENSSVKEIEASPELIKATIVFTETLQTKKIHTIAYVTQIFQNLLKTKEQLLNMLYLLQMYYEEVLHYKIKNVLSSYWQEYEKNIKIQAENNTLEELVLKLNVIYNVFEKIDFNANQNLLMDKLIIDLCGGDIS